MNTRIFHPRLIAFFMLVLLFNAARSQEAFYTVSGVLQDRESGDRVSFAAIGVPGTGIGTVSNSDGEFTLKVDTSMHADFFEVSHLSYATSTFSISDALGQEKTYLLDIKPVELKEFTVVPEDAREMVEMAMGRIDRNYSSSPMMMTGFYRESIVQNKDYVSISEAVVDIYKASYHSGQDDQVKIFKGRKGSNVKKADTLLVELQGGPNVMMLLDVVKNPDLSIAFDDLDNYQFAIESVASIDDRLNWVISFSPIMIKDYPLYYGKLYLDEETLAITRAEFSMDLNDEVKAVNAFVRKKPLGLRFKPVSTSYLVNYKEADGKYYLNYVRVELRFKCDWKRKIFRKNYTLTSELAITDRKEKDVARFSYQEIFKSHMIFTSEVDDFTDENFWGANNIIEPEKSIEYAIKKLSKDLQK